MDTKQLTPKSKQLNAKVPFPYNHPDILIQYRGQDIVVVEDQFLGILGEIDFKAIQRHYRKQGKEPVIICIPPN